MSPEPPPPAPAPTPPYAARWALFLVPPMVLSGLFLLGIGPMIAVYLLLNMAVGCYCMRHQPPRQKLLFGCLIGFAVVLVQASIVVAGCSNVWR